MSSRNKRTSIALLVLVSLSFVFLTGDILGQITPAAKTGLGSNTAKNGFRNEDDIKAKFLDWHNDTDAKGWLGTMGFKLAEIEALAVTKPHDEKADIEVSVKTKKGTRREGISIKLVSSPNGFNQIDKRWVSHYAKMWQMPPLVETALRRFVGEIAPIKPERAANRIFLDELDNSDREAVIAFFTRNKREIVSDLFQGDGPHAAGWVIVAFKSASNTRWTLRGVDEVIRFYSDGPVVITSGGNLKIGRITMQRKGGDAGRDTAKMLQFKINPTLLFELR